jgi:hypothetical protein
MKLDRKKLVLPLTVLAFLVVIYFIAKFAVLDKAARYDSDIRRLQREVSHLKQFNQREGRFRRDLKDYAAQTFGLEPFMVSEQIRVRIDKMVSASGMRRGTSVSTPISGKTEPGVYEEVGWSYDLIGTLDTVVNMMYLLKQDPYMHRLDGLRVEPTRDGLECKLSFRYVTIVMEEQSGESLPTGNPEDPRPIATLEGDNRPLYERIVNRNLFRPVVPMEVAAPEQPPGESVVTTAPADEPADEPPSETYRVIDLSRWGDQQDILMRNTTTGQLRRVTPGGKLGNWQVVMVDHRRLPRPDNPQLLSPSRIILKIGETYYGVELGATLSQRYPLDGDRLPARLRKTSETPEKTPDEQQG